MTARWCGVRHLDGPLRAGPASGSTLRDGIGVRWATWKVSYVRNTNSRALLLHTETHVPARRSLAPQWGPSTSPWLTTKGFSQPCRARHPSCRGYGLPRMCNVVPQERNRRKSLSRRRISAQCFLFRTGFCDLSSCPSAWWSPQLFHGKNKTRK